MRKPLALALVITLTALAVTGCSDGRKIETPPACLGASSTWVTALSAAPDQVLLAKSTPISECIPQDQGAAQLEEVGKIAVETATQFSAFYKGGEGGSGQTGSESSVQAALMAGYLVGALEKGAESSEGIHAALVTRVKSAATNGLEAAGQQVQGAFQKGHEAGRETG